MKLIILIVIIIYVFHDSSSGSFNSEMLVIQANKIPLEIVLCIFLLISASLSVVAI